MTRLLGLNNQDIPRQLNNELNGYIAGTVMEGTTEVPIRVRLDDSIRHGLSGLAAIPLMPNTQRAGYNGIPLEQLATILLERKQNV